MPRAQLFQEDAVKRMVEMYELSGCSLAKIAVEYGVSVPTIAKYLRKAGVPIKARGRPAKKVLAPIPTVVPVKEPEEAAPATSPIFKF